MTQKEKQIEKLLNESQDATWKLSEMVSFLKSFGYTERKGKGSHTHFLKPPHRVTLTVHGKKLRVESVKDVRKKYLQNNTL